MVRETSAAFTEVKNAEANQPVWLFRVAIDDNPTHDLFLAESEGAVAYFKDTNTPQTYAAAPIKHGGISENTDAEVDVVKIQWGNVNREVQAYLELHDGLRGKKVTIRQVFRELLGDPAAHLEDVYYIDGVHVTPVTAEFTLTSKLDVMEVVLPCRKFNRHFCAWAYKQEGCWLAQEDGTFNEPEDFKVFGGGPDSCNKTLADCTRHNNIGRFGGFPGVPGRTIFTT